MYHGVTYDLDLSNKSAVEFGLNNGEVICVAEGRDECNGSYDYEIHVFVRKGQYIHEGDWVAVREYVGGLNRLSDNSYENCDTKSEAVATALGWAYDPKPAVSAASA